MTDLQTFNDAALILACDESYLPFTLHLAWQVACRCPTRQFDILIASERPLHLPDWAIALRIGNLALGHPAWIDDMPMQRLGRASYLRLEVPGRLAGIYRRLLYLDSDIYLESGDLDRLMRIPMGPHAIAAVRDINWIVDPAYHAQEFLAQGLGALPYFNAGMLVIDTAAFVRDDLLARGCRLALGNPAIMRVQDQSLLNAVVAGRFAELSPVWNWMNNIGMPFATLNLPIRFRHFVGQHKPWHDPHGRHDLRYHDSYADFFRALLPEAMGNLTPRPDPRLNSLEDAVRLVIAQARRQKRMSAVVGRFSNEWDVKI